MIAPETIEQIRLATDIVELIKEYVPTMKKVGRNWKALCPFHSEKTPSFMINADKGIFHCFGCHAGGDAFKFIMLIDNISWPEAIRKLADRAGITVRETKEDVLKRSEKQKLYDINEQAATFYNRCLTDTPEAAFALKYLRSRGVTDESIKTFCLGFARHGQLLPAAAKKGYSAEQLMQAGLITKTERGSLFEYMSERLVFPIFDTQGRVVGFGGRTLKDDQPKYLNTPETVIYSKSANLYGLYQAAPTLRTAKEVVLLEGYMDVVVTHQCGVKNTAAALGTALTQQQAKLVERFAESVVLLFDADDAGNQAARRAIESFLDTSLDMRVVNLPDGLDPDEYILKESKTKFLELIGAGSKSAIEFLTELSLSKWGKNTPEAKVKVSEDILPVLNKVKNEILQREWIRYVSHKLTVSEDALLKERKRFSRGAAHKHAAPAGREEAHKQLNSMRSAEEELLQILVSYPQYAGTLKEDYFNDERNRRVFALFKNNTAVSEIAGHLDGTDSAWFTELALEDKNYTTPEQTLNTLIRGIKQRRLELQRQQLEKEVILMLDGRIPMDDTKLRLYQDLNKQLKGSVKL